MRYILLIILLVSGCGTTPEPTSCKQSCVDRGHMGGIVQQGYCMCLDRYLPDINNETCNSLCIEAGYNTGVYDGTNCTCEER